MLSLLFRIFGGRVEACHPKPEVILRPIQEGEVRPVSGVRQRIEAALRWIRDMAPRGLPWLSRQVRRLWSDPLCRWEQAFAWRIEFYQPDVLHVHDLPLLKVAVASQRALKVPLVFDAHELYSAQPRMTPARRARALKLEARYLPRADRTITVNPFLAREIESRHGLGPVAVVQNAIDAPELLAGQRYDLFRRDYGWSPSRILLLYHGWIAPERNLEIALRGMKAVRNPRYLLIFMGYGDYARELRQMADRAGLSDRVAFVPAKTQEELMPYVASADIGLVPYPYGRDLNTHFASPNKLYELIVAGVPILTNELPFVRDVVRQRQIGVSADIQSEPGFAAALDAFPLERLAEFKQNLLRCQAEFTWKTEGEKIKEIYREVTKG